MGEGVSFLRSENWARYAWATGLLYVAALVAEAVVSLGLPLNQDDSAAKIAHELDRHSQRVLVVVALSIVYALSFLVYLGRLDLALRRSGGTDRA